MNKVKHVLVRVVHMLQDINTLMQALARVVRARLSRKYQNMPKNNQTFVTNARTLINPVSEKNMFDIHQNIRMRCSYRTFYRKGYFENRHFSRSKEIPARMEHSISSGIIYNSLIIIIY